MQCKNLVFGHLNEFREFINHKCSHKEASIMRYPIMAIITSEP